MADILPGLAVQPPDMFGKLSQLQNIGAQGMENQQAQMSLAERQRVSQVLSSGKDPNGNTILDENGEPDPNKVIPVISKVAPTTGQQYIQSIIKTHADKVGLSKQVADLSGQQREALSGVVGSFIGNPQASAKDINGALDAYLNDNPSAAAAVHYASNLVDHVDSIQDPKQKDAALQHLQGSLMSPSQLASYQQPSVSTVQGIGQPGQPGAGQPGLVPTNINPRAPGGIGQVGPVQQQSVAPGATPVTDAYGRTSVFNPQRNTVAPIGGAGVSPGGGSPSAFVQPVAGQRQVEQDVDTARKAGDSGGQVRAINDKLINLSEQTRTGPGAQGVQKLAAALNLPSGSNYQEINAYLERQAAAAGQAMGLPNTNAGLHAAQQASGTAEYTPQALQEKVKFADALNSGVMAYRQGLDKLVGTGATPDYTKYQAYRSAWAQNFSPDVFRAEDAIRRGDKKELAAIKAELGSRGMAEMKAKSDNLRLLEKGQLPQ